MRYFLGFLIILGLIILGVILFIRLLFGGGGGETPAPTTAALTSYARTSTVMQLVIQGPIVADQDYRQIQIDVGNTGNEIRMITGFQGNVANRQTFSSNADAYANFLRAIDLLGYTNGDKSEALADERGYCPQGNRFVFSITDGSETKQRFWSTSCDQREGSFQGDADTITDLFKAQIPGYDELTSEFRVE